MKAQLSAKKSNTCRSNSSFRASSVAQSAETNSDKEVALPRKEKPVLPPVAMKTFKEPALDDVTLEVTSLRSAPVATLKPTKPKIAHKVTETRQFMMIREAEFPHLFKDPIVQHQKMSKYFEEQDYNSDCETI